MKDIEHIEMNELLDLWLERELTDKEENRLRSLKATCDEENEDVRDDDSWVHDPDMEDR